MPTFQRTDRLIAAVLLAMLVGLVGLGIATRSGTNSTSSAPIASQLSAQPGGLESAIPLPSTASTSPPTTTAIVEGTTAPSPLARTGAQVSAVGDSVLIDMQPYLEADMPGVSVNGLVSRQFESGIGVVQADRASGTLRSVLVVELGTNGTITSDDFDAMMHAAEGVKRVVFLNVNVPRSWEASDNAVLAAGVTRYPGLAVLADWYSLSTPHPEWFTPDQVHLEAAGAQAMAALAAQNS